MKDLKSLLIRLTSRKFLLALAGLITLAANRQWVEFTVLLGGYLGINIADAKMNGGE